MLEQRKTMSNSILSPIIFEIIHSYLLFFAFFILFLLYILKRGLHINFGIHFHHLFMNATFILFSVYFIRSLFLYYLLFNLYIPLSSKTNGSNHLFDSPSKICCDFFIFPNIIDWQERFLMIILSFARPHFNLLNDRVKILIGYIICLSNSLILNVFYILFLFILLILLY
jgi:hypothetical protein